MRRILAWGVHAFTAAGALVGVLALLAVVDGAWRSAVLWMLLALAIDALDGMLARGVDVQRHAARLDGRRLDDIVDFLNYAIVPVVFLVATGLLPSPAWAAPPILASAYGFAQVDAKTEDDYFLGFPSYWNVVAIYAWLLEVSPALCAAIVTGLSVLVFVPYRYIYPSKLRRWRRTTFALATFCALAVAAAAWDPERTRALRLVELSLVFPAWYLALSAHLGGLRRGAG